MVSRVQQLLDSVLQQDTSVTPEQASIAAGMGNQAGALTMSPQEAAIRTQPSVLGNVDLTTLLESTRASQARSRDLTMQRNLGEALWDTGTGVLSAFGNSIAGMSALNWSAVSPKIGTAIAGAAQTATEAINSTQSEALQGRQRQQALETELLQRDTRATMQRRVSQGESPLVAGLKRIGEDAIDAASVAVSDPLTLGQGTAEAVGSLVTGGPVAGGIRAAGSGVVKTLEQIGARVSDQTRRRAGNLAWPAATALLEGGGAYSGASQEVMGMSFESLAQNSPDFLPMVQAYQETGMSLDEARIEARTALADQAGRTAAAIQAPIGAATGVMTRFAETPTRVPSVGQALSNVFVREPLEEAIQGTTGQLAQNYAVQQTADRNLDITEGVGQQTALGAIYGAGAAGTLQAPGAVLATGRKAIQGVKASVSAAVDAGQPLYTALVDRGDRILRENEKASPVSDQAMNEVVTSVNADPVVNTEIMSTAIDETPGTPEQKEAGKQYVSSLAQAFQLNLEEEQQYGLSPAFAPVLEGSANRVEAIHRMAQEVTNAAPEAQLAAAASLYILMDPLKALKDSDPEVLATIPATSPARDILNQYNWLVANLENNPTVKRALAAVEEIVAKNQTQQQDIPAESLATPEGQQAVATAVAISTEHPDKGNLQTNQQILTHAENGVLQLSQTQLGALRASVNILRARENYEQQVEANGLKTAKDVVSSQIVAGNDPLRKIAKSALQHTKEIISAYRGGNTELATARLEDFGKFVQHMQNSVGALNEHFALGNPHGKPVQYMQLQPTKNREFKLSKDGKYVNTLSPNSVDLAQSVGLEASILADVYNGLTEAFPDLGQSAIAAVPLNPALVGNPVDLVRNFRNGGVVTNNSKNINDNQDSRESTQDNVEMVAAVQEDLSHPIEETTNEEVVENTESKPKVPVGLDRLYNNGSGNFFATSFSYPNEAKTRIIGQESPLQTVREALTNDDALGRFTQGAPRRNSLTKAISDSYKILLEGMGSQLETTLQDNLAKALAEKNIGERFKDGTPVNRWADFKVLNLVTEVDGNLVYDQELLESSILAGIQWYLQAGHLSSIMDEADVAEYLGITEAQVTPELMNRATEGISIQQAKSSLAQTITRYWGMNANPSANLAYAQGIPEAMAAEVIRALIAMDMITVDQIVIDPAEFPGATRKTPERYITRPLVNPNDPKLPHPIASFPDAIETAVVVKPKYTNYIGDQVPPVAQKQMNNPEVNNTAAQIDAITKEQQTPFYVNPVMVSFFGSLGKENLLSLFGTQVSNPEDWNVNHMGTVEGQNLSIVAAYDQLFDTVRSLQNHAETTGQSLSDIPVRYAYNMSRVGRMQMLGRYNPQSSKLVREAILPTFSTLDLSNENSDEYGAYMLGIAQAFGVKVHNMSESASRAEVEAMLAKMEPALEVIRTWLQSTDVNSVEATTELTAQDAAVIKQAFSDSGADMTMVGLHALVDYVRLQSTEDKTAYKTPIYLEADGVTNGPINAMALMSIGSFTNEWVENIRKGGLVLGNAQSMADIRRTDPADMYQASVTNSRARLALLRNTLGEGGVEQMDNLLSLMSLFNKDVIFNPDKAWEDGALELKRGVAKNPLTITLYGSGTTGIAGKLTANLVKEIYAAMSRVIQARKAGEHDVAQAMFPGDLNADAKLKQFVQSYQALISVEPRMEKGRLVFGKIPRSSKKIDPKTFTVKGDELAVFEKNMHELFVKPMREGIEDTVGAPLMKAVAVIRDTSQIQSIFYKAMFDQEIDNMLADKEANDPNWRKGDFLSQQDLNSINRKLRKVAPLVKTGDQTFMIAGQESMEVTGRNLEYSRALDGSMRTDPSIYAPAHAGVRAIPMMTIGMGDGMMMQILALLGLEGTLKIFDGMNMPLNKIREFSLAANKAVYESWKGNPHKEALKAYDLFLNEIGQDTITDAMYDALTQVLFDNEERRDAKKAATKFTNAQIMERIQGKRAELEWSARSIDARHAALDSLPVSLDQMAAAAQPYTNGKEGQASYTVDEAVQALNAAYATAFKENAAPTKATKQVTDAGESSDTGVTVLNQEALDVLAKSMTPAQKAIYADIKNSLAARDYRVVTGSMDQLRAYLSESGKDVPDNATVHGWTNIGDKTIYLVNPTTETLVHELVHASTYETVLTYYNNGIVTTEVKAAIGRIETLLESFLELEDTFMVPELRTAYDSARSAILSSNLEADQAIAKAKGLNEFMAWSLTNEHLTKTLKAKANPLTQIAKDVIQAIKRLVWGKKIVSEDFLSNLQFNTGIVARAQPSVGAISRDGELYHAEGMGDTQRLAGIRNTFNTLIADLFKTDPVNEVQVNTAQMTAMDIAMGMQAQGFNMTPAESLTFRTIVAGLATEASIDPNAMAKAQELYSHITKNLTVESFMADPSNDAERYYAQQKYNAILGSQVKRDSKGRSTLLPSLLGLATVNEEFRAILRDMPVPEVVKNTDGTLDAALENLGNTTMESLSKRLSGQGNAKNVQDALDNLVRHIQVVNQDTQSAIEHYASVPGGIMDSWNNAIVGKLETLSDAVIAKADQKALNARNKLESYGANFTKLVASMVSEKNGALVAEGVMSHLNKLNVWTPFYTLVNDLVGRTASNANVYDMIKTTRAMVQQLRQQFRDDVPQILADQFSRKLSAAEWTTMFKTMGKTDLAVLRATMSNSGIQKLFGDSKALSAEITKLETEVQTLTKGNWSLTQSKMKQLANFMNTGIPGANLLRNAHAIANLWGENPKTNTYSAELTTAIDKLVSLYALEGTSQADRDAISSLVQSEANGLSFVMDYLVGQRKDEVRKSVGIGQANAYKGYIPSEQQTGVSMIVADDSEFADLTERGYKLVGAYNGSSLGKAVSRSYYYAPFTGRPVFSQGIMQNVKKTAGGVDVMTGFSVGMTAGRVVEPTQVNRYAANMKSETNLKEALMPIYGTDGSVIAFERAVNPEITSILNHSTDLAKMIGVWRGRQVEEALAQGYNERLIDKLHDMYKADIKESSANQDQYVDLLSSKNPIVNDAVSLFTDETMAYIKKTFGDQFFVRKDMINDAVGYRNASVSDIWSGNTEMSKATQDTLRRAVAGVFGMQAYQHLVKSEQVIQNLMADARTIIVVKSMVVPVINFISNVLQLMSRGVPVLDIGKSMPKKVSEIETYTRSKVRQIEAEAELRATQNPLEIRKLRAEIQSITDSHKRMTIWPLVQAGEFSTIADVGMSSEDLELTSGKLYSYMEGLVNKLPKSVQTAGRYALVTKDTALFRGLQKSVQYGDFIAKAVLFDDLTQRKGMTQEQALARITEEFVNYDRLPGRFRGYLENMGLLWFYNFKIRISKIALSTIRNNPLHALMATALPTPDLFGNVGTPIEDNLVSKAFNDSLGYSMGPGMGFRAPTLNPWYNMVN